MSVYEDDDEMNEKAWAMLIKSGPWAALAAVLLYVVLGEVRPALATIKAQHDELRAELSAEALRSTNVMGQVLMAMERSNYLERRNCINTARTQTDREACAKDRD